jgi:hypothetical protein
MARRVQPIMMSSLEDAYRAGFEAAQRGEEAAPGCTATPYGRAWLDGYIAGRRALSAARSGGGA